MNYKELYRITSHLAREHQWYCGYRSLQRIIDWLERKGVDVKDTKNFNVIKESYKSSGQTLHCTGCPSLKMTYLQRIARQYSSCKTKINLP